MKCHKLSIEMNWPEHQTEHAWGITGFYFIFIPFYLGEWCDRRIFADFWILNKLILAGMALQLLSSKQAVPSKFILHDFTQNWSKLEISGSNCLGIQKHLIEYRWWGCARREMECTPRSMSWDTLTFHSPSWSKWEGWKNETRK